MRKAVSAFLSLGRENGRFSLQLKCFPNAGFNSTAITFLMNQRRVLYIDTKIYCTTRYQHAFLH